MSDDFDDVMQAVGDAKPYSAFSRNYLKAGTHLLELKEIIYKRSQQGKRGFHAEFIVIESQAHKVGEIVTVSWKMSHHKEEWQAERDKGRLNAFVAAFLGPAFLGPTPTGAAIKGAIRDLIGTGQPGRGIRVRATGYGEKFVEVSFENVPGQTGESIKANRARQESNTPPAGAQPVTPAASAATAPPPAAQAPAPVTAATTAAPSAPAAGGGGLSSLLGLG